MIIFKFVIKLNCDELQVLEMSKSLNREKFSQSGKRKKEKYWLHFIFFLLSALRYHAVSWITQFCSVVPCLQHCNLLLPACAITYVCVFVYKHLFTKVLVILASLWIYHTPHLFPTLNRQVVCLFKCSSFRHNPLPAFIFLFFYFNKIYHTCR